jgi:hypothetical protein
MFALGTKPISSGLRSVAIKNGCIRIEFDDLEDFSNPSCFVRSRTAVLRYPDKIFAYLADVLQTMITYRNLW